jgi:small subunit ribosomal protein S17
MRKLTGKVVFAKMSKTAAVEIKILQIHPLYLKRSWKKRKYLVHNEMGAVVGDKVVCVECRPISKLKSWRIVEIIGKRDTGNEKREVVKTEAKKIQIKKVEAKSKKPKAKGKKLKTKGSKK